MQNDPARRIIDRCVGTELDAPLFVVYGLLAHQGFFHGPMSAILSEHVPCFTEPAFVCGRLGY